MDSKARSKWSGRVCATRSWRMLSKFLARSRSWFAPSGNELGGSLGMGKPAKEICGRGWKASWSGRPDMVQGRTVSSVFVLGICRRTLHEVTSGAQAGRPQPDLIGRRAVLTLARCGQLIGRPRPSHGATASALRVSHGIHMGMPALNGHCSAASRSGSRNGLRTTIPRRSIECMQRTRKSSCLCWMIGRRTGRGGHRVTRNRNCRRAIC